MPDGRLPGLQLSKSECPPLFRLLAKSWKEAGRPSPRSQQGCSGLRAPRSGHNRSQQPERLRVAPVRGGRTSAAPLEQIVQSFRQSGPQQDRWGRGKGLPGAEAWIRGLGSVAAGGAARLEAGIEWPRTASRGMRMCGRGRRANSV